jgi:hypothetical protein
MSPQDTANTHRNISNVKCFRALLTAWVAEQDGLVAAGRALGCSASCVHYWLGGASVPRQTRVPGIALAMGLSEDELREAIRIQVEG